MSPFMERLRERTAAGQVQPLELALADWCLRHGGTEPVALAMVLASRAVHDGHSCLRLDTLEPAIPGEGPLLPADAFMEALDASPLVGAPGDATPLVHDGRRLYLQRYWQYETRLAARLSHLLAQPPEPVDTARLARDGGLFDYGWVAPGQTHWQPVAAAAALRHRLTVISGGPGTGKTYTVLRLMRLLIESAAAQGRPAPAIRLAAPTGKAAARMLESVRAGLGSLPDAEAVSALLPDRADTLHRLLGLTQASTQPRHHGDNPLPADAVIVDEASMVDLPMMAKLTEALPDHARLILLGDRYQLASVESGSVLAELCDAAGVNAFSADQYRALGELMGDDTQPTTAPSVLGDHVVTLRTSHRFHADSAIGRLAAAINAGDGHGALAVGTEPPPDLDLQLGATVDVDHVVEQMAAAYLPLEHAADRDAALDALEAVRLLTATRVGPAGSEHLNQRIHERLASRQGRDPQQRWYHGRPVMVLQNDYRAGLFNGDTGVCLADGSGGLRVWFRTSEGARSLLPSALPGHETVYAMTIHKSQGSEFTRVTLLLPDADTPVLTRELLYTGITRAREQLTVVGPAAVFQAGIERRTRRESGLAERLGGSSPDV
ncbi:exodeoxyribonuclease V subunit alpha [Aquisalimonas sp. APHAB1-3]|uniref:exodeoxyribonuclease V subunit alpha n=2 Tax=unclassified Aquisalimonas TaxID=2644645 RepID=UPI003AAE1662